MQFKYPKERIECEAAAKENKFRHTARRTVIKISRLRDNWENPWNLGPH
jgi:hypothetical protein